LLELEKEQDEYAAKHQPKDDAGESTIEAIVDGGEDAHAEEERKKRAVELKLIKEETASEGALFYFLSSSLAKLTASPTLTLRRREYGRLRLLPPCFRWRFLHPRHRCHLPWCSVRRHQVRPVSSFSPTFAPLICPLCSVNLALRQWASAYDNREIEPIHLAAPVHIASSLGLAAVGRNSSVSTNGVFDKHDLDPDFWLKMYCLAAVANFVLITSRVIFCAPPFSCSPLVY
jgi:hypothetical protein